MSYFIFNGINSEDLGLIIKKPMIRPTWSESFAEKALSGNPRKLMQKSDYYENSSMTIEAYVHEATPENMRKIYSVLKGSGKLWISTAPDEMLDVILSPLVPQAVALLSADLPINVLCLPFAYAIEPTVLDMTSALVPTAVKNEGTVFSAPEIRIVPAAENIRIGCNGKIFEIDGLTVGTEYIIDCDLQVVYYVKDGQNIDITSQSKYNFPLLHSGDNYIANDGNVSEFTLNIRERWL